MTDAKPGSPLAWAENYMEKTEIKPAGPSAERLMLASTIIEMEKALELVVTYLPSALEGDYDEDEPTYVALQKARAALRTVRGES